MGVEGGSAVAVVPAGSPRGVVCADPSASQGAAAKAGAASGATESEAEGVAAAGGDESAGRASRVDWRRPSHTIWLRSSKGKGREGRRREKMGVDGGETKDQHGHVSRGD